MIGLSFHVDCPFQPLLLNKLLYANIDPCLSAIFYGDAF